MSYRRYMIDLAFKEPINSGNQGLLTALEAAIKNAKKFAVKINEGKDNEEMTVKATMHKCYHDETPNRPCEGEIEL